ncbi:hypothetical protein PIB30_096541 [Stylosanthes scabra]|uniref:Uncharacterized protein n=1 Tax=Stylosanthes scabra TaxID=79078 RepID=A0ABU6QVI9_9FABA|nr:hypothetical protein [Stylosanthes scabra]
MDRNGPAPSAKGKAKAYGPPTRASPRLVALRSQSVANPRPEIPVPSNIAPTPSLPPKKRPIQKAAGEGTSKAATQSFRRQSQRIAAIGRTFTQAPNEQEAPQDTEVEEEEEEEEDPEEDPKEESAAKEVLREEDDFADYWELMDSESEDAAGDDLHFWNFDGDLPDWGNADPANSSSGMELRRTPSSKPRGT